MATPPITAGDIPALDNDCALIRSAAQALGRVGSPAITHARQTINAWREGRTAYEAPEAPTLLAALDPTMPVAHQVFDRVVGAERALTAYADTAEPLILELRSLLAAGTARTPEAAAETQARIRRLVAELDAAERDCEAELRTLAVHAVGGPPGAPPAGGVFPPIGLAAAGLPVPPAGASPAEVRTWWQSLGPQGQAAAIGADPRLIGRLDGIPIEVRDRVNRPRLPAEIARLEAQQRELEGQVAQLRGSVAPGAPAQLAAAEAELQAVGTRLGGLRDTEARLDVVPDPYVPGGPPQAYLVGFDPDAGSTGRAIVALGNPDLAHNVVTQVPGVNTDLGDLHGEIGRAEAVRRAAHDAAPYEQTAVIAWLGYETPGPVSAAVGLHADAAVEPLQDFQEGLRATHVGDDPSLNTTIGHSYGSTAIGHTARSGPLDADRIVAVGSPGMGVDHVSQLGRPPGTVYASASDSDPIDWVDNFTHGPGPSSARFGAEAFASDPDGGHSDYWRDEPGRRNAGLTAMGRIVTGQEP